MSQTIAIQSQVPKLAKTGTRIDSLDLLRGIAILGIFLMNTWTMSLPQEAYTNPAAYNPHWVPGSGFPVTDANGQFQRFSDIEPLQGLAHWVYVFIHLFADMKFISTFSILFGAGIVLQAERSSKKGNNPWLTHYLRMSVLLMFGLCHTFGFWYGDILTDYALLGMVLAPMRKLPPALLFFLGMMLIMGDTAYDRMRMAHIDVQRAMQAASQEDLDSGKVSEPAWSKVVGYLDDKDAEMRTKSDQWWKENLRSKGIDPSLFTDSNDRELQVYQSGWWDQIIGHRFWCSVQAHTTELLTWTMFRCGGCMLLGMALQRRRFFHAAWPREAYATIAGFAIPVGWMITLVGVWFNVANNWNSDWPNYFSLWHLGVTFNYYGSLIACFGYLAFGVLLAIWAANPAKQILKTCLIPFRAVGRMALSCYLTETLIGTTIFYGHGFGQFGKLTRPQLLPIVFGTWTFLLIFATVWLKFFKQGPLEWLWHSIAYWDWQNPLHTAAGPDATLNPSLQGSVDTPIDPA